MFIKTILIAFTLFSSISAFSGFDAGTKLKEGKALYAKALQAVDQNELAIFTIEADILDLQRQLVTYRNPDEKLKKIYQLCSQDIGKYTARYLPGLAQIYTTDLKSEYDFRFAALKNSVSTYLAIENCESCDAYPPEDKLELLKKYRGQILLALRGLKVQQYSLVRPKSQAELISSEKPCNFKSLFAFDDTKKFTKLHNQVGTSYAPTLTALQIISGDFSRGIDYVSQNAPVPVVRKTSRFKSEYSEIKNSIVVINISYDHSLLTGYDNIKHPKRMNPLYIITGFDRFVSQQ